MPDRVIVIVVVIETGGKTKGTPSPLPLVGARTGV